MRENVSVLNEDADGNKNVPFKIGVRIRADRRDPSSGVYELKSIYKNSSHSARCQSGCARCQAQSIGHHRQVTSKLCTVWEKLIEDEGREEGQPPPRPEVIVSFSPAGTPDTVKYLWASGTSYPRGFGNLRDSSRG
jgi:hypothetical protein